jgi:uncharacterized protein (TIGR00730 family)
MGGAGSLEDVAAGAGARIDGSGGVQLLQGCPVAVTSLALGDDRSIPVQSEPAEIFLHACDKLRTAAIAIEIVVAQPQFAAGAAGPQVRDPESPGMAEVQPPGGRRGEATTISEGRHGGAEESGSFGFESAALNTQLSSFRMSKLLCVYCASSDRLDPKYYAAAAELGSELVRRGWGLVYGGGKTGMMGAVARAVKQAGGRVVGVIPEFMKVRELAYDEADEIVTVITMRERKLLMETRADAFVALPGGWGTLEEIAEILTLRQLEVVKKPCVFLNQDGFYDPLLQLFDRMLAERFFKPSNMQLFRVATTVEEVFRQIDAGEEAVTESKWFETR